MMTGLLYCFNPEAIREAGGSCKSVFKTVAVKAIQSLYKSGIFYGLL